MSEEINEENIKETAEERVSETVSKSEVETAVEPTAEATPAKKSKLSLAKEKIEQAKTLTVETREQIEVCMQNIDKDIAALTAEKASLFSTALEPCERLLQEIGAEEAVLEAVPESRVELLEPDEGEVEIPVVSSGRFKGFFFALLSGLLLLAGWCFAASRSLGLAFPPTKIPDMDRINKMLEWTSSQLGQGANANIGAAAVVIAVLLLMWIVYAVIVSVRANSNLKIAHQTEEAVTQYCSSKEECKEKMKLVREHLQQSTKVLEKYKVLLTEQHAKIQRALFFEEAEEIEGLHALTKSDIATTQQLIAEAKKLLEAPISEAGILTQEAIETLKKANKRMHEHVMKLYS